MTETFLPSLIIGVLMVIGGFIWDSDILKILGTTYVAFSSWFLLNGKALKY